MSSPPKARAVRRPVGTGGSSKREKKTLGLSHTQLVLGAAILAAVVGVFLHSFSLPKDGTLTKLAPEIAFPQDQPKNQWGTLRSQTYFGLRTKDPKSLLFGVMWYEQPPRPIMPQFRHTCEQGDRLHSYAWNRADGRTFGQQRLNDSSGLLLSTEWLSHEDTFSAKLVGKQAISRKRSTVILYFATQDSKSSLRVKDRAKFGAVEEIVSGEHEIFGSFTVDIDVAAKYGTISSLAVDSKVDLTRLNDLILVNTMATETENGLIYQLQQQTAPSQHASFVAVQLSLPPSFEISIAFNSQNHTALKGLDFDHELKQRTEQFDRRFEAAFQLSDKGYSPGEMRMAQLALSNMLGSIGYFYGHNKVQLHGNPTPALYGPHALLTAVPSRPFFPRGFLWDEGFHNMLIRKFDEELSLEILVSWLNTMNADGWIPREMILGAEAESRVPAEFVVQKPDVANPPSWFYVIWKMINHDKFLEQHKEVFESMYPKLAKWYNWLRSSQRGPKKGTFRWRGRNATIDTELNPKTLASGLDDYPRASHPSKDEYHLDLRCWMVISSRVMSQLSDLFGTDSDKKKYADFLAQDSHFDDLVEKHWSENERAFVDFGSHSRDVQLKRVLVKKRKEDPGQWVWKRVANEPPALGLVDDVFGYNSLYPLIARLIPPNSKYLAHTLDRISDEKDLWSPYGLRSVSLKSSYYAQRNTEHDAPYWRGYVWININYLTLSALKYYSSFEGALQQRTQDIFDRLRHNLVSNIALQLESSGYIWENYDDKTGEGRGSHPFTGWSALVLMIMSDELDG